MIENEFLAWLEANSESVLTPAYFYTESALEDSFDELKMLFPENVRVFYSLKANPQAGIVRHLSSLGVGSEIASDGERQMCSVANVPAGDILVGGVSKSAEYLASICDQGVAGIVIESPTEWRRLSKILSSHRQAQVLFRVNPGVSLGGLDMAGESQFGLEVEQAIVLAKECLMNPYAEFVGIHAYFGSQRLSVDTIVDMVNVVGEALEAFFKADIRVSIVDLGLGCGVPYLEKDDTLDLVDLRARLHLLWKNPPWSSVWLWTEAGRALVGRSGFYVARVLERKMLHNKTFIFLDGGINAHNPGVGLGRFFRINPRLLFVHQNGGNEDGLSESVEIVGNLCTSADSLGRKVIAPILEEGDLVVIPNSGAYCQTTGFWGFNSQPLFSEAMLARDGRLSYLEPQYRTFLSTLK